jgi:hypothetical protein
VLTTAIQGLTALNAHVVVSTGRVRSEQLGTVPDNVTVQAWVPQADLLPHVDVVVHHGGSGTTLGALTVGAPQLILPQGADQFANAEALSASGAALCLLPDELSVDAIAEHAGNCCHTTETPVTATRPARSPRRSPGCPPRSRSPATCRNGLSTDESPIAPHRQVRDHHPPRTKDERMQSLRCVEKGDIVHHHTRH